MASSKVSEKVTQRILDQIQNGVNPWRKPYAVPMPYNLESGRHYSGSNVPFLLWLGFSHPGFLTFKQVKAMDGNIKTGEKAAAIFFCKEIDKENEDGELQEYLVWRYYHVFNVSQTTISFDQIEPVEVLNGFEEAQRIVEMSPVTIETHNTPTAAYSQMTDRIRTPHESFRESDAAHYSTIFHEMIHSTGHKSRLDRESLRNYHIDRTTKSRAYEELVAEIGAAILCSIAGIANPATEGQSASYIDHWNTFLEKDPSQIIRAAKDADAAVNFIMKRTAIILKSCA